MTNQLIRILPVRNQFFDILKGYAIFLVVFGHVIQSFMPECETNRVFLFIYSFHMPLFMAVSGYFFLNSVDKKDTLSFIKNKFQHLMIPSLTMGIINCCIIGGGKLLKNSSLELPYFTHLLFTGLWFLTVLFILSVVGCLLRKLLKDKMYYGWAVVLVCLYFCPQIWVSHELKYLAPFYVGSIALSRFDWSKTPYWILIVSTLAFAIMLMYFDFSKTMYRMDDAVFTLAHLNDHLFRLCVGVLGCITSILICRILTHVKSVSRILAVIGSMTLPIYALHQKILEWNNLVNYSITNCLLLIILAIIVTEISIALYRVLRQQSIVAYYLFGEKNVRSN